ncbi:MAG: hypothetical protein JWQ09_3203 [Segetibacter sp.]|nr:hypothetical protein [Segetibacter sp.]
MARLAGYMKLLKIACNNQIPLLFKEMTITARFWIGFSIRLKYYCGEGQQILDALILCSNTV